MVAIEAFWMGATEVTQKQYETVMGKNPSVFKGADLPVENVSSSEAEEFCEKLTGRLWRSGHLSNKYKFSLPSEEQWEYACRAGVKGNEVENLSAIGWFKQNSGKKTHPVRQKLPNAWGLYDMHGNVWEWCRYGICRGGGMNDDAERCRATSRTSAQTTGNMGFGLRIVIGPGR